MAAFPSARQTCCGPSGKERKDSQEQQEPFCSGCLKNGIAKVAVGIYDHPEVRILRF